MTIIDSRVRQGILTLDGDSYATQATNVKITPNHEEQGARLEVLDGSEILPSLKRRNTLALEAIQDFDNPDGIIAFSWTNDTLEKAFSWTPGPDSPTYSGTVQVLAIEVGGEVGPRLTTNAEWEIVGDVTVAAAV